MKFIDEAKIYITSGNGGNGGMSFRREAHTPRGGPDGGNGGNGGNVIFKTSRSVNTLIDYRFKQHYKAKNGEHGKGKNRNGKNGADIILTVPIGTQIFLEDDVMLADLVNENEMVTVAEGGKGGLGNTAFKTSRNQAPRKFQNGKEGKELLLKLKLKVISDIGIIGFPNAGKSTLLSTISRATPKIADYPFTTLRPELGVVYVDESEFIMADIPGLIAGASEGVGLGHKFLKHIERCNALLHLIDINSDNIIESYKTVRKELENYSKPLTLKKEIIALNKIDLMSEEEILEKKQLLEKHLKKKIFVISAASLTNITELKRALKKLAIPEIE